MKSLLLVIPLLFAGATAMAQETYVQRQVTCSSIKNKPASCSIGLNSIDSVVLTQQLSNAACVYGQSYDITGNIIRVNQGCRAVFSAEGITSYVQSNDVILGSVTTTSVLCESIKMKTATCSTGLNKNLQVVLSTQHSNSACIEGSSYKVDLQRGWITVTAGCRATFYVRGVL